ncbi:hypothetical protein SCLCIDRAFT_1208237 [Scleroderma citrinum Foug A]|uniref:Uncharacterized protein n=1 Tax=Scleroderma citrinum Foug A TaxID=1036808 RepID=A0A0C3EAI0_9AGAM|nr:hypothetical protein SCLCIDRAFT_1208237 [Scleroderma citrinum Foug A]
MEALPALLGPVLDYLSERLPPPLYSFVLSFLTHTIALLTALVTLVQSLVASKPWEWDAQAIVPPLISLLAAYLALHSLYRTTGWAIRTVFWFVKWGTILAVVSAGMGWYIATQNAGIALIPDLGGILLNVLNGDGWDTADARQSRSTTSQSSSRTNAKPRSKPWESFSKQHTWQYQEQHGDREEGIDARRIMSDIAAAANHLLVESQWWDAAKGAFAGATNRGQMEDDDRKKRGKKHREKSR